MSIAFAFCCAAVFLSGVWSVTDAWTVSRAGDQRFPFLVALPRAVSFMAAGAIGAIRGDWVGLIVAVLVAVAITWISLAVTASMLKNR